MKLPTLTLALLLPLASSLALPATFTTALSTLTRRATGTTANDLEDPSSPCRPIILIFARGTTEPGNLGDSPGPRLCDGLKAHYGAANVACQGVNAPYKAELAPNVLPKGSTAAAFDEAARLFRLGATKCPASKMVGGGYSQGGAVMHGAATRLSAAVRAKVVGLTTFGDSQNAEDRGMIPPFPPEKVRIICNKGDNICEGGLLVFPTHSDYDRRVPEATAFLVGRIGAL